MSINQEGDGKRRGHTKWQIWRRELPPLCFLLHTNEPIGPALINDAQRFPFLKDPSLVLLALLDAFAYVSSGATNLESLRSMWLEIIKGAVIGPDGIIDATNFRREKPSIVPKALKPLIKGFAEGEIKLGPEDFQPSQFFEQRGRIASQKWDFLLRTAAVSMLAGLLAYSHYDHLRSLPPYTTIIDNTGFKTAVRWGLAGLGALGGSYLGVKSKNLPVFVLTALGGLAAGAATGFYLTRKILDRYPVTHYPLQERSAEIWLIGVGVFLAGEAAAIASTILKWRRINDFVNRFPDWEPMMTVMFDQLGFLGEYRQHFPNQLASFRLGEGIGRRFMEFQRRMEETIPPGLKTAVKKFNYKDPHTWRAFSDILPEGINGLPEILFWAEYLSQKSSRKSGEPRNTDWLPNPMAVLFSLANEPDIYAKIASKPFNDLKGLAASTPEAALLALTGFFPSLAFQLQTPKLITDGDQLAKMLFFGQSGDTLATQGVSLAILREWYLRFRSTILDAHSQEFTGDPFFNGGEIYDRITKIGGHFNTVNLPPAMKVAMCMGAALTGGREVTPMQDGTRGFDEHILKAVRNATNLYPLTPFLVIADLNATIHIATSIFANNQSSSASSILQTLIATRRQIIDYIIESALPKTKAEFMLLVKDPDSIKRFNIAFRNLIDVLPESEAYLITDALNRFNIISRSGLIKEGVLYPVSFIDAIRFCRQKSECLPAEQQCNKEALNKLIDVIEETIHVMTWEGLDLFKPGSGISFTQEKRNWALEFIPYALENLSQRYFERLIAQLINNINAAYDAIESLAAFNDPESGRRYNALNQLASSVVYSDEIAKKFQSFGLNDQLEDLKKAQKRLSILLGGENPESYVIYPPLSPDQKPPPPGDEVVDGEFRVI
ncbi:MAG: hypothetical protein QHH09_02375 [Microgenomates group bacterium]|nr:hypothetical protein [Microgenomates group bacterium]